jgi:general secretion pathway protein D
VVPSTEAVQSSDLITNKRAIKTTISAVNGETLVLGGLIQDDFTDSEQKVPLLGDIPVVGRLFKSKNRLNVKRNLLVFLRPKIIRDAEAVREVTRERYRRMKTIEMEIDQSGNVFSLLRKPKQGLPEDNTLLLKGQRGQ